MQVLPKGEKVLVFTSGKRVELTEAEYAELETQFKKIEYYPVYPNIPLWPGLPYVTTCHTGSREILSVF